MERFIALHIITVKIVPDAPTKIPPTTMNWLSNRIPAAAPERPEKELSREITTGISAPPIGATKLTP